MYKLCGDFRININRYFASILTVMGTNLKSLHMLKLNLHVREDSLVDLKELIENNETRQ